MASGSSRMVSKASFSLLKSAIKSNICASSSSSARPAANSRQKFPLPNRSISSPLRSFSLSRSPSELGCVQSLLPLHNAVASARMTCCLSTTSRSCRALSQDETDGT